MNSAWIRIGIAAQLAFAATVGGLSLAAQTQSVPEDASAQPALLSLVMQRERVNGELMFRHHLITTGVNSPEGIATLASLEITHEPVGLDCGALLATDQPGVVLWRVGQDWTSLTVSIDFDGNEWTAQQPVAFLSEASTEQWALVQRVDNDPDQRSLHRAVQLLSPDRAQLAHLIEVTQEQSPEEGRLWLWYVQDLMVTDVQTGTTRCALAGEEESLILIARPEFSPDSRYLAFQTIRARPWLTEGWEPPNPPDDRLAEDLRVWDSMTGETSSICPRGYKPSYTLPGFFTFLAWDDRSERILFLHCDSDPRMNPGAEYQLWVAHVDGTQPHPIPMAFNGINHVIWHPAGRSFIAHLERDGTVCVAHCALDGSWERILWQISPPGPEAHEPDYADHWAISPEGRWLAIWRTRSLYLSDLAEGHDPTPRLICELPPHQVPQDVQWWTPTPLTTSSASLETAEPVIP